MGGADGEVWVCGALGSPAGIVLVGAGGDYFGKTVNIKGGTIVCGAVGAGSASGSAYR